MNASYLAYLTGAVALQALALAFVLPALWRHAGQRRLAWAFLVAVPLLSVGLYTWLGAPGILQAQARGIDPGAHDVDAMVQALGARLARDGQDAEGWYVLGRSELELEHYVAALKALDQARLQAPDRADYLAAYAEALALSRGDNLSGEAADLIARALKLDPLEPKALELAGLAAYQAQDYSAAVRHWRLLLPRLARASEQYEQLAAAIGDAEQLAAKHRR